MPKASLQKQPSVIKQMEFTLPSNFFLGSFQRH
jgi:hypothetical protein